MYYNFDDGTSEDLLDEVFATKKEAEDAALYGMGCYSVGNETLQTGGEEYSEANIIDYEIVKV